MYSALSKKILGALPGRGREVLLRRYGFSGEPETLEEIGEDFGITRERVRQLENAAFAKLAESGAREDAAAAFRGMQRHLEEHGDLRREEALLADLTSSKIERPAILFLLDLGDYFQRHRETEHRHTVWTSEDDAVSSAEKFAKDLVAYFNEDVREALEERAFWRAVEVFAKKKNADASEKALRSWVDASKLIDQGPLGTWGPTSWEEVTPRGAGDRAWLVLRREGNPVHFEEIARLINEKYFKNSDMRPVHMQTVHNELIKDNRFVLVGRGLYALTEWGYTSGTVKDVVEAILKEINKPMSREDIIKKVLEQRMVKPTTVQLSLSDRKKFLQTSDGRYSLK